MVPVRLTAADPYDLYGEVVGAAAMVADQRVGRAVH
jgi:hypothetical protein